MSSNCVCVCVFPLRGKHAHGGVVATDIHVEQCAIRRCFHFCNYAEKILLILLSPPPPRPSPEDGDGIVYSELSALRCGRHAFSVKGGRFVSSLDPVSRIRTLGPHRAKLYIFSH